MSDNKLRIYQLPIKHPLKFRPFVEWTAHQTYPEADDYECIYTSTMPEDTSLALEEIFAKFNSDGKPNEYLGHSLSISDVVVIDRDGESYAYYCDTVSFMMLQNFIPPYVPNVDSEEYRKGYAQAIKDFNTPMTPIMEAWTYSRCPRCHEDFSDFEENDDGYITRCMSMIRCPFCGQKLEW